MAVIGAWALAQGARADVGALIEKLPAQSPAQSARIFGALTDQGEAAVAELAAMLRDPEEGGDVQARFALHGMALWVARPGAEAEREAYAKAVAAQFGNATCPEAGRFLVRQLLYAGGKESVEALAGLVLDQELGLSAIDDLTAIGPAGAEPLRAALPRAQGRLRIAVIDALGSMRDDKTLTALAFAAGEADREVRLAALFALADSADETAVDVIGKAVLSATGYERAMATAAMLRLAERFREGGKSAQALKIYRGMWQELLDDEDIHLRCAALRGMAELEGAKALPMVSEAQLTSGTELAAAALAVAVDIPGPEATRWIEERAKAGVPAQRVKALEALAGRQDRSSVPTVRKAVGAQEPEVRLAAIKAAGALGDPAALPELAGCLASAEKAEREEAYAALAGMPAERQMAAALPEAAPAVKVKLLEILGKRVAVAQIDRVLACADDPDMDVRRAALSALSSLGGAEQLELLVKRMLEAGAAKERDAARGSFVAIVGRQPEPESRAGLVLAALPGAGPAAKASLLSALPTVGGAAALAAAREALDDANGEVKEAAVRALSDWPTPEPAEDLLMVTRNDSEMKRRVLALRGYVRLVGLESERSHADTVVMYAAALSAAPRPEDRSQVFAGLAKIVHIDALALAKRHLKDKACRDEAGAAILRISRRLGQAHQEEAMAALKQVKGKVKNKETKERAKRALQYLKKYGDFVTDWLVCGEYAKEGVKWEDLLDVPFEPENPEAEVKWHWPWQDDENETPWRLDLGQAIGGENCVGYMRTFIRSPKQTPARLEIGSDDGVKVWLNGKVVHVNNVPRGIEDGEDKVPVELNEGWNTVMLKVSNGGGDWGASMRVRSPSGKRIKGLEPRRRLPSEERD